MNLDTLTPEEKVELYGLLQAKELHRRYNKIDRMYPDKGTDGAEYGLDEDGDAINPQGETWSRHLYQKQLEFFKAGAKYNVRVIMAANRIGKTEGAGGPEVTYHMTGIYPHWWEGRRFTKPIRVHACGKDNKTVVDSLQLKLLGPVGEFGTGLIPKDKLDFSSLGAPQKADANVGTFRVKHVSGGWSSLTFKTYDSGRKSFEGFESDFMWLDEEPPEDVYGEAAKRLMTTQGLMVMTFTPTNGITKLLSTFFGESLNWRSGDLGNGKYCVLASWDDVPHITAKAKAQLYELLPMHQRQAASKGIPELGSGIVYPVDHDLLFVDGFEIPKHWKRYAAMDFGWEDPTAITWHAIDPTTNTDYQYAEHYMSKQPVHIHAGVIKAQNKAAGFDIPIVCDPSGGGKSIANGDKTRELYLTEHDIVMVGADNSLHAGIAKTLDKMVKGQQKFFRTCVHTKMELSAYRTENGNFKGADHLLDTVRYGVNSGDSVAISYLEANAPVFDDGDYHHVSHEARGLF